MASRDLSIARSRMSRALLAAVDRLAMEFPDVPLSMIYVKVGEARVNAARRLPNVSAYQDALEREARAALALDAHSGFLEVSAGTSSAR